MKMETYQKRVYGVLRVYPACKLSMAITKIKKMPTLTMEDVKALRLAGVDVVIYDEKGEVVK